MVKVLRFLLPILFAACGFILASEIVLIMATTVHAFSPTYDLISWWPGNVESDVAFLLGLSSLAGIIVFIILGIPIAAIFLAGTRLIKVTSYEIDIAQIGHKFGGIRMIRRAAIPALFAVAISGVVMKTIAGFLFTVLQNVPPQAAAIYKFLEPIVGALIVLPVVLVIFIPTWILNDAGIVMHLKENQLEIRRCPDTIGVGRWWSNLLTGFTLFTVPLIAFVQNFIPLIISGETHLMAYLQAFLQSLAPPFFAMAFVMPVIIFSEIFLRAHRRAIRSVAKRLGARELKIETIVTETKIVDEEPEYGWEHKSSPKEEGETTA